MADSRGGSPESLEMEYREKAGSGITALLGIWNSTSCPPSLAAAAAAFGLSAVVAEVEGTEDDGGKREEGFAVRMGAFLRKISSNSKLSISEEEEGKIGGLKGWFGRLMGSAGGESEEFGV